MNKYHCTILFFAVFCMMSAPVALAAEVLCARPALTQALLVEIDAYTQEVRSIMNNKGCTGDFSLFGIPTKGEITAADQNLSNTFFSAIANADNNIAAKESEMSQMFNAEAAQLTTDLKEVQQKITNMKELIPHAMSSQCRNKVGKQVEKIQGQAVSVELFESMQANYVAFYALYGYMLYVDNVQYTDAVDQMPLSPTQKQIARAVIAKYKQSNDNPFYYFQDYKKNAMSQCVSKEMGLERISQSLQQLQDAWEKTQTSVNELAKTAQQMTTININVTKLAKLTGFIAAPEEERALIIKELRTGLEVGDLEVTNRLKNMVGSLRLNGKPLREFNFDIVQQEAVQVDVATGRIDMKSQSQIFATYLTKKAEAATSQQRALEEYKATLYDTFGIYTATEVFTGKMRQSLQELDRAAIYLDSAKEAFSYVCSNHLPSANNDCGEKKN